uniref:Ribonuclease G (Modular protein) n=1 Tax=mine drainage metagenome TaxID=410659 RepID=E6QJS5_9ZZZZ
MDMEAAAATAVTSGQRGYSRPAPRSTEGGPVPFLLPGESLSRYGASAPPAPSRLIFSEVPPDTAPAPPERTVSKPSTLIEEEILWDGKGLLPGESLARHRRSEPPAIAASTSEAGHAESFEAEAVEELDQDAVASHNVDPLPSSEFRLKDLFGGRRKDVEAEVAPAGAPKKPGKVVGGMSAYAPGQGLIEEEVIEEEEYEFTPHKMHSGDDHDSEELEEETLQKQVRSGVIGEMLHEVQLESRMRFERVGDEESGNSGTGSQSTGSRSHGRSDGRGGDGRNVGRGRGRGREGRGEARGGESRPSEGRSGEGRSGDGRRGPSRRSAQTSDLPIISDLLKPGQEILVQIAKEPIAQKGARITSHIALPGRFLVFMPTVSHIGVSRKIESDEERQRLKRILVSERGEAQGGFIVRTAADGASEEELRADLRFLINLWNEIKQRADSSRPPALIYHDLNLIERILRDQVSDNFSHIWVDSEADYERIVRFLNRFSPGLVRRVKLYTKEIPLFEHFGIQDEISKALRSKVWLKSGGSIVINQTEALVAIDINTGKYVGKTARLEDTILKTNLDAIPEIVRQIRLRDLGGIIVIDFIDMDERKNRTRVLTALEDALKQDRAPTKVLQFNDFGLVAITRKRVKQSLERTLSVPCPVCQATGMVKSPATVANEIYIEMRKMRKHFDQTDVMLRVHPETAKALKANNARWVTDLEALAGKNVLIKNDATLHPEQFDIQG